MAEVLPKADPDEFVVLSEIVYDETETGKARSNYSFVSLMEASSKERKISLGCSIKGTVNLSVLATLDIICKKVTLYRKKQVRKCTKYT